MAIPGIKLMSPTDPNVEVTQDPKPAKESTLSKFVKKIFEKIQSTASCIWRWVCWIATPITFVLSKALDLLNWIIGRKTPQDNTSLLQIYEKIDKTDPQQMTLLSKSYIEIQSFINEHENITALRNQYSSTAQENNAKLSDLNDFLLTLQNHLATNLSKHILTLAQSKPNLNLNTDSAIEGLIQNGANFARNLEEDSSAAPELQNHISETRDEFAPKFKQIVDQIVDKALTDDKSSTPQKFTKTFSQEEQQAICNTIKKALYNFY